MRLLIALQDFGSLTVLCDLKEGKHVKNEICGVLLSDEVCIAIANEYKVLSGNMELGTALQQILSFREQYPYKLATFRITVKCKRFHIKPSVNIFYCIFKNSYEGSHKMNF